VVTPIAAEGIPLFHGEHLMIAPDDASFAQHVIEVYEDEQLWTRLSDAGRRQVEACFGYDVVRSSVSALLDRASSDVGRRSSSTS
jgi:hypothetical protein